MAILLTQNAQNTDEPYVFRTSLESLLIFLQHSLSHNPSPLSPFGDQAPSDPPSPFQPHA